jgi:hypothetical protein
LLRNNQRHQQRPQVLPVQLQEDKHFQPQEQPLVQLWEHHLLVLAQFQAQLQVLERLLLLEWLQIQLLDRSIACSGQSTHYPPMHCKTY